MTAVHMHTHTGPLAKLALSVNEGDFVVINYIAYLRDGTIFDNTVKRGKPLAFQIGKKQVVPGLEKGLMGMKAGEQRQVGERSDRWGWGV
jgi:FKBP-type peptidyl-prolyl cis-trans isomerase